ncbi:TPA: PTS sugar transporter subunit IIB [Escherichia coli]|uniref:PTS sugar transporter subunit IIB n=1 Tax=Escherichia coli TaxID=562 RepID=UPI0017582898|nr:hypothetical protein [Escherichia coli]HAI1859605.1 PTS sugar transporter subunit IIB [Escherichia coli]HAI1932498.1 PTS sugar transporter subunit IIB [Escherichia coli]HBV8636036.1 PTS sugar transporter subunit IIB [Escherichia coli]HCT3212845.1 PTS sugar transporter subunit IIB [Escherichia coli]
MSIVHARIDYRLIHGQVITKWLKRSDANKIIVIDDPLSRDPFLAEVYKMAAPSGVENTPGRKIVFNQISLNHEDADKLQIIEDKNIKVYFQTIPEEDPASLQKIKNKLP